MPVNVHDMNLAKPPLEEKTRAICVSVLPSTSMAEFCLNVHEVNIVVPSMIEITPLTMSWSIPIICLISAEFPLNVHHANVAVPLTIVITPPYLRVAPVWLRTEFPLNVHDVNVAVPPDMKMTPAPP
jgi:hypothetical protein